MTYRWNPEDYLQHSGAQAKWARELIAKIGLKGDERLLDIGCGDGKISAEIARSLPNGSLVGIDSSPEMVDFAKNAFMDKFKNLAFHLLDVREMTFRREFDIVFSNAALHWVTEQASVLTRIKEALRPGGRVVLQMAGEGNASAVTEAVNTVTRREPWLSYFEGFPFPYAFLGSETYRHMLVEAGLTPRRVELIPKDMVQEGMGGFVGWVRTTWLPYIQRLPDELRDRFVDEIVSAYEMRNPSQEGLFHIAMVRLEVEAFREPKKAR